MTFQEYYKRCYSCWISDDMIGSNTSCYESCKCCNGSGTQVRKTDGLVVDCPCCGGKGYKSPNIV